ncbi:hypothetical protein B0J11DRAFT_445783 [Dendryphion nanum]|uniref:Copper acquisition factor BIM1-like domain-containing protein n=1 Tax=Dendryphion nanum TaxID=256645 RepID=A0A9P9D6T7_9PLEO|nr:hypothetical protein B0J11DRAFT_445783 [Dendryphion nanum]
MFWILSQAHFILQTPPSIGFEDTKEGEAPCGGFDVKNRDKVTEWPINGYPVHLRSTHGRSTFTYKAALVNNTNEFVKLLPDVAQEGLGDFCLTAVPGRREWVGLEAVVQIAQEAVDGKLYQCAAVKFTDGSAFTPEASCRNQTGLKATFLATATLHSVTSAPASSSVTPTQGASSPKPSQGASSNLNIAGIAGISGGVILFGTCFGLIVYLYNWA